MWKNMVKITKFVLVENHGWTIFFFSNLVNMVISGKMKTKAKINCIKHIFDSLKSCCFETVL